MRIWKFGDNIDTDAIVPGRFLILNDPKELAKHAFEGTRDEFAREVKVGDVIVAGKNFGCGSSREHAPIALKGAGITMIVAESFARIFYRNAINVGLLPIVCSEAGSILEGTGVMVDMDGGYLINEGRTLAIEPIPKFLKEIIDAGGLVEYAIGLEEVPACTVSHR
ncbi:MAG TPA: 3-isopropylmalate dehydratase small subunit [Methanoregulaceae archaeon]|nr:3-isopropylmalate dehydratase small subunit [Methanoregulaceae archaeon]